MRSIGAGASDEVDAVVVLFHLVHARLRRISMRISSRVFQSYSSCHERKLEHKHAERKFLMLLVERQHVSQYELVHYSRVQHALVELSVAGVALFIFSSPLCHWYLSTSLLYYKLSATQRNKFDLVLCV